MSGEIYRGAFFAITICSKGSGPYTSFRAIASQFYGATLRSGTTPFSKALGENYSYDRKCWRAERAVNFWRDA